MYSNEEIAAQGHQGEFVGAVVGPPVPEDIDFKLKQVAASPELQEAVFQPARAVVLLSGGMDSTTAYYWAMENEYLEVVATLHVQYGQRGDIYEGRAVHNIRMRSNAHARGVMPVVLGISLPTVQTATSALLDKTLCLNPNLDDHTGKPATFVPARNLIMLSLAASLAYQLDATAIVGGWVAIDNDYPDCRFGFLAAATQAINWALGSEVEYITGTAPVASMKRYIVIHAPLLGSDKQQVIELGNELDVPWELTRSCYADCDDPCMQCDSCLKRMVAFAELGMRDPLVPPEQWAQFLLSYSNEMEEQYGDQPTT